MSNYHPIREIPTQNQKMFQKHEVNNKLEYVYSNASQKAIDQKRSLTPRITVLARFEKEIVEMILVRT